MAGSDSSKDTQEEKPRLDSVEDQYGMTDWPSCLKLTMRRTKSDSELYTGNVVLSCRKVPTDKGPGEPEQEPRCPSYTCISAPTLRNCSTIRSSQIYQPIQCPEEGQEMQQDMQQEMQQEQLENLKCRARINSNNGAYVELCCPPDVLKSQDPGESEKKLLAPKKQQLSAVDHQEANLDHQTPETPRDHRTSRRKTRSSAKRRELGNPIPMLDHPTHTHIPLCLDTSPGYQHPELGQESSQGWVIGAGAAGAVMSLGYLGYLGLRWWRGRRTEQGSSKETLRAEEGLGKGQDGVGDTPGK